MARSRSGRSASRKSTPSSPPKPTVSTPSRSTRSTAQKETRASGGAGQIQDTSDNAGQAGGSIRNRPTTRGNQVEQKLPTVPETVVVGYPELPPQRAESESEQDDLFAQDDFSMSGSATHSAEERAALDFEELVDELSDLYSSSVRLLSVFEVSDSRAAQELYVKLQTPQSPEDVRLRRFLSKFRAVREMFGTNGYLIDQSIVLEVLRKVDSLDEVGNGVWRPDAIIQLANLSEIMANLFPTQWQSQKAEDALAHMQKFFPAPFMNGISNQSPRNSPGQSMLFEETVELALELRTQYVIRLLHDHFSDDNFDPDEITRVIFFADDHFRGWNLDGLQDEHGNLPRELSSHVQNRVNALREHFSQDLPQSANIQTLRTRFPWTSFLDRLAKWAAARATELKTEVRSRGGAEEIETMLRKGVVPDAEPQLMIGHMAVGHSDQTPRKLLPALNLVKSSNRPGKRSSLDNVHRLKERERQLVERRREIETARPSYQAPADDSDTRSNDGPNGLGDDEDPLPTQASQVSRASPRLTKLAVGILQAQREEGNKENLQTGPTRFLDPQEGARRVQWDDDEEEAITNQNRTTPRRKRAAADEEQDDEEGDFEEDRRHHPRQRSPRIPVTLKRARIESAEQVPSGDVAGVGGEEAEEEAEASEEQMRRELASATARHNAARSHSRQHTGLVAEGITRAEIYQKINTTAKVNALKVSRSVLGPQKRTPYSRSEENRILELVEVYGTSWTLIKKMDQVHPDGPELDNRSQVDLKDKCRNMAIDFYKANEPLPPNFEFVPLKTKDKEMLRQLGHDVR